MTAPLLAIEDLRTWFHTDAGIARAVDGVSLHVNAAETVGLVGESGCGKSVTAMSILRLIAPPGRIEAGSRIIFEGRDLLQLSNEDIRRVRGNRIAMVFQEPMTALNPVFTVGDQIAEVARIHDGATRAAAWKRAVEMLELVGIADPDRRARDYPHQLSGGMRQRVVIAMALVMRPSLVIADEPTTALDVTIQAQILELLRDLQRRFGMSLLLITHDLGVVAESASRVIVMYAGEVVEEAPVRDLFASPQHPYTEGLLAAMPRLGAGNDRLETIPGSVPPATAWPDGCRFRDRCAYAWERASEHPALAVAGPGRLARCHLVQEPARRTRTHEVAARP
jgi:oligopeptide/dipeptide ABC transporter ATP-binding protein